MTPCGIGKLAPDLPVLFMSGYEITVRLRSYGDKITVTVATTPKLTHVNGAESLRVTVTLHTTPKPTATPSNIGETGPSAAAAAAAMH